MRNSKSRTDCQSLGNWPHSPTIWVRKKVPRVKGVPERRSRPLEEASANRLGESTVSMEFAVGTADSDTSWLDKAVSTASTDRN